MKKNLLTNLKSSKAMILNLHTLLMMCSLLFSINIVAQTTTISGNTTTVTFPYNANPYAWTPPAGVTSITVEAWGGGGGGGGATSATSRAGGGGGGGSYVKYNSIQVSNSNTYSISTGAGGTAGTGTGATNNGANGTNTTATFGSTTVTAVGGVGGNGHSYGGNTTANTTGSNVNAIGGPAVSTGNSADATLSYYGGAGATGVGGTSSGGGGGAAGPNGAGGNAGSAASTISTAGTYGGNNASPFGMGGIGVLAATGVAGNIPGGGGSGGASSGSNPRAGGAGAAGQLVITYTTPSIINYYYKGTGSLATLTNWGTTSDGTGSSPANFTADFQNFIIKNTTAVSTDAAWTVSGAGSKIILGDASQPSITLTITSGFAITGTIDITAASSGNNELVMGSTTLPTLGTIDASTNLTYANGATTAFNITSKTCNTLKITNNTAVNHDNRPTCKFLVIDAGSSSTGSSSNWITISTGGNAILNGTVTAARQTGIFNTEASSRATIYGTDPNTPITLGSGSTIIYNRTSVPCAVSALTYGNLTIGTSAPIVTPATLAGITTVNGTLSILGGSSITTGGFALTVNSAFTLSENSTITLGSGSHNVSFATSEAASWTAGKTLTITGWTGTAGATGSAGKVFFGSSANSLTAQQLSQISFTGYAGTPILLSTGEIVPPISLPVSLTSFKGKNEGDLVRLSWTTVSESNNERFEILRAGEDQNFKSIGTVLGNGNANVASYYNFEDKRPLAGNNYYKLKQIDFDGKYQEYGTITVKSNVKSFNFAVYTSQNGNINLNVTATKEENATIRIYDSTGRKLVEKVFNLEAGDNQLNIGGLNLTDGMYVATINTNNEFVSKKFMK